MNNVREGLSLSFAIIKIFEMQPDKANKRGKLSKRLTKLNSTHLASLAFV